jgi:hypothetical protein
MNTDEGWPNYSRRSLALRRTDRMKFPGPGRPDPIADQVARVPEDVLTLVLSTLATLAAYRDALRAGREAELDGIHGAGRNTVRRHGRARLANALPVLRHFVRQGRPWDIDPYAVLRYLMPRPPEPATVADSIEAVAEELDPVAPRLEGVTVADIATPDPGSPHGNAVPGAPDASAEPEGPIYPPEVQDRSGASQKRPGRRAKTMPGQGSLFD